MPVYRPEELALHPEGGRFREVFRSSLQVMRPDGAERAALTHIYFELRPGERSRFHRVTGDEVWNLYRGALKLHLWDGAGEPRTMLLSADEERYCAVVPGGVWQAAEPVGGGALVGCSVGPGFEFGDFELLSGALVNVLVEIAPRFNAMLDP